MNSRGLSFEEPRAKKVAALWIDNSEKAADQALKFQAKATEWSKNTMFAPIFEISPENWIAGVRRNPRGYTALLATGITRRSLLCADRNGSAPACFERVKARASFRVEREALMLNPSRFSKGPPCQLRCSSEEGEARRYAGET